MGVELFVGVEGIEGTENLMSSKLMFWDIMFPKEEVQKILGQDFDFSIFNRIYGYLHNSGKSQKEIADIWDALAKSDLELGLDVYKTEKEFEDTMATLAKRQLEKGDVTEKESAEASAKGPMRQFWEPGEVKQIFKKLRKALKKNLNKLPDRYSTIYKFTQFDFKEIYRICDLAKKLGKLVRMNIW